MSLIPRPLLHAALTEKAASLPAEEQAAVEELLARPLPFLGFRVRLHRIMEASVGAAGLVAAAGDGTLLKQILDFLNAHWEDIMKIIMALLGGL